MPASVEGILAAYRRGAGEPVVADYRVLALPRSQCAFLAFSKAGAPSLLVPLSGFTGEVSRITNGLLLRSAQAFEFSAGSESWRDAAAVIECRDAALLPTFAAMSAAFMDRLDAAAKPSWPVVLALFNEWEQLLGRRSLLSGESEVGLWAEIWCLAKSSRLDVLVEGWCAAVSPHCDFLLDGAGLEVKASRTPGVHFLSQAQVDGSIGSASNTLLSLYVGLDPVRGRTLPALIAEVAGRTSMISAFEEKLAATGYSRSDEAAYVRSFVLMAAPMMFSAEQVPRIRVADPGVSQIRYRAELDPTQALAPAKVAECSAFFGLPTSQEYPCV